MRIEDEDFKVPNAQRGSMFWPVAVVALAAGAGIAWLGLPYLSKLKSTSEPTVQVTAQTEPDYYARLNSVEERLSAWARDKVGIMDRISQVEKSMSAGVRRA